MRPISTQAKDQLSDRASTTGALSSYRCHRLPLFVCLSVYFFVFLCKWILNTAANSLALSFLRRQGKDWSRLTAKISTSHRGHISSSYNFTCLLKIYSMAQNAKETSVFALELFSVQSEQSISVLPPVGTAALPGSQH